VKNDKMVDNAMINACLEYCLDGYNTKEEKIDSFESIKDKLNQIRGEASNVINAVFSVDVVVDGIGRISVSLDERSILSYTSDDYEKTLTSRGDETAEGETLYYFGDYSLMSNKYIIPYEDAISVLELWISDATLSDRIKWIDRLS
jgi:hypothetical protein